MSAMTENKTETFERVDFSDVHVGDRVQFVTANNGFDGGDDAWRTGTVTKVTGATVVVTCDSNAFGPTAVLRKYQPAWNARCVSKAVGAHTAADLPKGTRVTSPEGRMGTVNGVDVGRVTSPGNANDGREYVGVDWDAIEGDMGCNRRSRPFVDELTIETPSASEADEAPFQSGEQVVHADGRCFKFVSVNPEDSSRILVERPKDGRVVSWRLSECRTKSQHER